MGMKVKHIVVAALVGSSAIGLMLHRLSKRVELADPKPAELQNAAPGHKMVSANKITTSKHRKTSDAQLSSKKLYG